MPHQPRARKMRPTTETDSPVLRELASLFAPARCLGDPLDALVEGECADAKPVGSDITGLDGVAVPDFQRIQAKLGRDQFELGIACETQLRNRMPAQGPAEAVVGIDAEGIELDVGHPVREVQHRSGEIHAEPADARIGAAVRNQFAMLRQQPTVCARAGPQPDLHGVAHVADGQDLVHPMDEFHRPPGLFREQNGAEVHRHGLLLAAREATADERLDDAHAARLDAEPHGQLPPHHVRAHLRGPERHLADVVPHADAGVRLEHSLLDGLGFESVLADVIRFGKRRLYITEMKNAARGDVARGERVHLRRAGLHGCFGIEHRRQRFVLDLNQVERFFGRVLVDGRHRGDLVPDVTHGIDGERQVVAGLRKIAVPDVGKIASGHDRAHARQRGGPTGVDAHDPRMRVGAAQELPVQHPGHGDVVGVLGAAGGLEQGILLRRRPAENMKLVARVFGHVSSSPWAPIRGRRPGSPRRSGRSPCSGTDGRPARRGSRPRSAAGFRRGAIS